MGDKSVAFVQKALEYSRLHEALRPPYLDVEAFDIDLKAVKDLQTLERSLAPVVEALSDSQSLSASEAYLAALVFYANVKNAAKLKIPGAQGVYDDLSARFPGAGASARATPPQK